VWAEAVISYDRIHYLWVEPISNGLQQTIDRDMEADVWEGSMFHILLHGLVKIKIYIYADCRMALQQI
jgi:hypothetical protein